MGCAKETYDEVLTVVTFIHKLLVFVNMLTVPKRMNK